MHGLTIVKSLLVRVFLLAHGLICAWRVVDTNDNQYCWIVLVGLGFLLVETGIVIWLRNGQEFKTVAFSIIFYLTCTIPSLWIIHVETANRKLFRLAENRLSARAAAPSRQPSHLFNTTLSSGSSSIVSPRLLTNTTPYLLAIRYLECHDKAWYHMDEQRWLDALQETMLVVLAVCRLLISREHMSVEKSGIVLLITLINGADLLAMSHSLQYHDIIIERLWMYVGLVILSIALFQMAFIDTDGLTTASNPIRPNQKSKKRLSKQIHFLQDQNICPLFRSLFVHDGLILLFRIFLAAKVRCSKPTIIFFLAKNLLMIAIQCYRVYHAAKEQDHKKALAAYKQFISSPSNSQKHHRHPFNRIEQDSPFNYKQQQRLLHRTLRRPFSINRRRKSKTPRTLQNLSRNSISYPFARRRNDGGRARTAFALYGLPFRTPETNPRPTTISSCSSLIAKAFVH